MITQQCKPNMQEEFSIFRFQTHIETHMKEKSEE